MNVFMFPCIKVTSSMSFLIKRLFLQFHLGISNSDTEEEWADSDASFNGQDTNEEWAISCASLDGDDNGLVFSKQCPPLNDGVKRCFNTFKKKICFHPTEMVLLNHVGQYVIFPARWWHLGYFQIKSNTT